MNFKFSKNKQNIINAIYHRPVDRIPIMYRALPPVNQKLLCYFSLEQDISKSWKNLLKMLNADTFSGGSSLGKFTKYIPKYTGSNPVFPDSSMLYAWGIQSIYDEDSNLIGFKNNELFSNLNTLLEIKQFSYPTLNDFNFEEIKPDLKLRKDHFLCTGCLNCIFMISMYLRGFEKLMVELMIEKKLAHYYIDRIGEFAFEVTREILSHIGKDIDMYGMWDDLATQRGLMISHDIFSEYYLPWYRRILSETKKYNLISMFHVCGNANEIIPALIDIGVDILDPVQTSAHNMNLENLKKEYGRDVCFHGGIDVQTMLPKMKPSEITDYVFKITRLFARDGGIILGPSHEITQDTPLDNIFAIYRPDLL